MHACLPLGIEDSHGQSLHSVLRDTHQNVGPSTCQACSSCPKSNTLVNHDCYTGHDQPGLMTGSSTTWLCMHSRIRSSGWHACELNDCLGPQQHSSPSPFSKKPPTSAQRITKLNRTQVSASVVGAREHRRTAGFFNELQRTAGMSCCEPGRRLSTCPRSSEGSTRRTAAAPTTHCKYILHESVEEAEQLLIHDLKLGHSRV